MGQILKLLRKLYDKSEIWFAVAWIIAYCVLMSLGDFISYKLNMPKAITVVIAINLLSLILVFIKSNNLSEKYGLCKPKVPAKSMMFYIPAFLMLAVNLLYGVGLYYKILEMICFVLTMICVGFLEEIIFRGFLFEAMKKDDVKLAIIVSSLTFGIGHILNMFNGSGVTLLSNILQVVYATSAGFMFVMMYYKSKSLTVCIATHSLFNVLGVFAKDGTPVMKIVSAIILTVITGGYAIYLMLSMKKDGTLKNAKSEEM